MEACFLISNRQVRKMHLVNPEVSHKHEEELKCYETNVIILLQYEMLQIMREFLKRNTERTTLSIRC
jgi:hypothetical protein